MRGNTALNNGMSAEKRVQAGVNAGIFGLCCNLLLFAIKIFAGGISGSIAIIADAFNNLSDAGSSIVTVIGFHIAKKPADREHPFGHGRAEYISGLIVSFLILLVGFELFSGAIEKIMNVSPITVNYVTIILLAISIAIKFLMAIVFRNIGKKIQSPSLMGAMTDSISDMIATGVVIVSVVIYLVWGVVLDGWLGAAVAIFVFIAGIKSLKTTVDPLLGQAPDPDFVDEIKESVLAYVGVFGIHDMLVHNYGANRVLVSLHVEVSAETDIRESHDLIDRIERDLAEKLGIMAVIHMDPIETTNEKVNELRAMSQQILKDIDPSLSLHDFRIVDGPNHTNLIYDVLVPHKVKIANCELCEMIEQETQKRNPKYSTVVTVDKSFIGE